MSGIARISSSTAGGMGSSRFRMDTARPPRRSRPSCMPAMLIPCPPQSVPMRPITPGTSRLAKTSIQPWGSASMGNPSIRTKRSEEHTSELQSQSNLVCRLLLEKKKTNHHVAEQKSGREMHNHAGPRSQLSHHPQRKSEKADRALAHAFPLHLPDAGIEHQRAEP